MRRKKIHVYERRFAISCTLLRTVVVVTHTEREKDKLGASTREQRGEWKVWHYRGWAPIRHRRRYTPTKDAVVVQPLSANRIHNGVRLNSVPNNNNDDEALSFSFGFSRGNLAPHCLPDTEQPEKQQQQRLQQRQRQQQQGQPRQSNWIILHVELLEPEGSLWKKEREDEDEVAS